MKPLLPWENNKYYIFRYVCVCVCECVCVYVGVGAWARACACARVALLIQHATRRHIVICGFCASAKFFDIIS